MFTENKDNIYTLFLAFLAFEQAIKGTIITMQSFTCNFIPLFKYFLFISSRILLFLFSYSV